MLYLPPGSGLPARVHGAFVHDDGVHRVVEALKEQGEPNYVDGLLEGALEGETGDGVGGVTGFADAESDPLYDQAVEVILKNRRASISRSEEHTSELQSLMRISYAVFCLKKKTKDNKLETMIQDNKQLMHNNKIE